MHSLDELAYAHGAPVYSGNGERIGAVEEIFYEDGTGRPAWIGVGTGFLRLKRVVVPAAGASLQPFGLVVPYPRDVVAHSPDVDGDELSPALEARLGAHYGIVEPDAETVVAPPPARRVRRHLASDRVWVPVTLQRERVRVVSQRVGRTLPAAELGELWLELPLHAQEPVVTKRPA